MKTVDGPVKLVATFDIQGSQVPAVEAALAQLCREINVATLSVDVPRFHVEPAPADEKPLARGRARK